MSHDKSTTPPPHGSIPLTLPDLSSSLPSDGLVPFLPLRGGALASLIHQHQLHQQHVQQHDHHRHHMHTDDCCRFLADPSSHAAAPSSPSSSQVTAMAAPAEHPRMRAARLIGRSNPRYRWENYWKTDEQLRAMKRPLRQYYERTNGLVRQYLYIDRLLDSSRPYDLLEEYEPEEQPEGVRGQAGQPDQAAPSSSSPTPTPTTTTTATTLTATTLTAMKLTPKNAAEVVPCCPSFSASSSSTAATAATVTSSSSPPTRDGAGAAAAPPNSLAAKKVKRTPKEITATETTPLLSGGGVGSDGNNDDDNDDQEEEQPCTAPLSTTLPSLPSTPSSLSSSSSPDLEAGPAGPAGAKQEAAVADWPGGEEDASSGSRIVTLAIWVNFVANAILLGSKVVVIAWVPSMSVLASLVDAGLDFLSTAIVWLTAKLISRSQRDQYHYPVGRRRLEPVGVLVFSVIMITSFVQVAIECLQRLFAGVGAEADKEPIQLTVGAVAVMAGTVVIKGSVWMWCRMVRNSSVRALADDAKTDVIFNLGSILFPIVGASAGVWWLDSLGGLLLSAVVIRNWTGSSLVHIRNLTGFSALPDQRNLLLYLTMRFAEAIRGIQSLRAYHAGDSLFVEVDIVLDPATPLRDSHDLSEVLTYFLEAVPFVDRAFVHVDYASYHAPSHLQQGEEEE